MQGEEMAGEMAQQVIAPAVLLLEGLGTSTNMAAHNHVTYNPREAHRHLLLAYEGTRHRQTCSQHPHTEK